ncbi:MAG TPA: regucalcin, partial [Flavobacteriaceae bacterium]|nr:regucalcin [Flavobacteriaceae bacterium]
FDPKTGSVITRIELPAHNVTSCAFGGPNLDILYITTATVDMTEDEKIQFPLAGSVFKVIPGVKGVPSSFFGTVSK